MLAPTLHPFPARRLRQLITIWVLWQQVYPYSNVSDNSDPSKNIQTDERKKEVGLNSRNIQVQKPTISWIWRLSEYSADPKWFFYNKFFTEYSNANKTFMSLTAALWTNNNTASLSILNKENKFLEWSCQAKVFKLRIYVRICRHNTSTTGSPYLNISFFDAREATISLSRTTYIVQSGWIDRPNIN